MIHNNLFTSNFKKIGKRIGGIIAVIVLLNLATSGLNFLYVDNGVNDSSRNWSRILWHNFYEEEENIDYLYLGSSHVYCDLKPSLLNEINGENNFNLSSGSQRLNGTYYCLREADKEHEIKHVYIELYYQLQTGENGIFLANGARIANWRNTDFMRNSGNRLEYIIATCSSEYYVDAFLPFVRYRECLFDVDYVRSQLEYKQTEDYKNYIFYNQYGDASVEAFQDGGYRYSTTTLSQSELNRAYYIQGGLRENPLTEEAEEWLRKIIMYCKENDIEVTLFSSPMYELEVLASGNYDNYVDQIQTIAAEYEVDYYDFNLCKEAYLPLRGLENHRDIHHLNDKGATIFTEFFWKVMQGTKEENEIYFYDSWEEKLRETDGRIYGLLLIETDSEEGICYEVASNWNSGMEYRILLTPQDGETVMLQDFSENRIFEVAKDEHGICTVVARKTGETEQVQTLEIEY